MRRTKREVYKEVEKRLHQVQEIKEEVQETIETKGMLVSSVIYPLEIRYGTDTILLAPRQRTSPDILKSKMGSLPQGCTFVPVN